MLKTLALGAALILAVALTKAWAQESGRTTAAARLDCIELGTGLAMSLEQRDGELVWTDESGLVHHIDAAGYSCRPHREI